VLLWPEPAGAGTRLPGADKAVHAVLFAALAGTARLRYGARARVLGLVLTYAVVTEVLQDMLLPRRSGDPLDLVADVVGALAAWSWSGRRGGHARGLPPR
jgi:VanZ family protein